MSLYAPANDGLLGVDFFVVFQECVEVVNVQLDLWQPCVWCVIMSTITTWLKQPTSPCSMCGTGKHVLIVITPSLSLPRTAPITRSCPSFRRIYASQIVIRTTGSTITEDVPAGPASVRGSCFGGVAAGGGCGDVVIVSAARGGGVC